MANNDKTVPKGDQKKSNAATEMKKPETDTELKKPETDTELKKPAPGADDRAGKKGSFIVASPLRHDGKKYAVGSKVSLTTDEAAPLLLAKTIEEN